MSLTTTVDIDCARDRITEYILSAYRMREDTKFRTHYRSQSLYHFLDDVDPESIVSLYAKSQQSSDLQSQPTSRDCMEHDQWDTDRLGVDYIRDSPVSVFPVDAIHEKMEEISLRDLCIKNVTIQIDNDELYDELYDILDVVGVCDMGGFEQPLYATLEHKPVHFESTKEWMEANHPSGYFAPSRVSDDSPLHGMGWTYRTLNLTAIHSRNGRLDTDTHIAYDSEGSSLTMNDIEAMIFNYDETTDDNIAPINSRVVTSTIRSALSMDKTATKSVNWDTVSGWNVSSEVDE